MAKYLVKLNELNDKNNFINENITSIRDSINNISELGKDVYWIGQAKEDFFVKYEEYIKKLNEMYHNLESCLNVTKKYQENYQNGYQKIKTDLNKLSNEVREDSYERKNSNSLFNKNY